jgi:23S rRNA (guanine2445-N2)-methyltransferase / 23S rRNA (guanine2069-N7)-methyltransferase
MQNLKLFVTGHKGFETLLLHELREIAETSGAALKKRYGGVEISAGIDTVYRICLQSRLANRVFCELAQARIENETQLYEAVYQVDWNAQFSVRDSIAVAATVSDSRLSHGQFVALKTKDAIVDRFRDSCGSRPVVSRKQPDIQLHVNIHRDQATISIDLSGESLHRRGYRLQHSGAPLKEHLAAALLIHAGWCKPGSPWLRLVDPMCGSGTFAIEAAMMAAGIAPGLGRRYFGFTRWLRHDAKLWQELVDSARQSINRHPDVKIHACDYDVAALEIARDNAKRAGVEDLIQFSHQQIADLELPASSASTLVICNPPFGRRLQSEQDLAELYGDIGQALQRLAPARLALLSANPDLLHRLKLKRISRKEVRNGPLDCLFAIFETTGGGTDASIESEPSHTADEIAVPLRNRLTKNSKHLRRWASRNGVSCYRLYDADLPEFAFALDRYQSEIAPEIEWYHLQEYQAPASIESDKAENRIRVAVDVVRELFSITDDRLYCKIRSRQRGAGQYQKLDHRGEFFQVREGAASLLINLSDYLDSGLFLDHRPTREMVYRMARDKSVLNLFCYTAAVGVQAALGGASSVTNIDLSATYLKWARENFALNRLDDENRYRFLRADIVELLEDPGRFSLARNYDLIFLDPPSFSNSSKMQQTLDLQRDHQRLIKSAMTLLAPDGLLLFSTNRRGFRLDDSIRQLFETHDISRSTLPEDFRRNPKIHRCWEIRRRADG